MTPAGYLKLGDHELGEGCAARCVVKVTHKAKAKVDKKPADGKSDAITTAKGREPADIDIELTWKVNPFDDSDVAADLEIRDVIADISPRGKKSGKPQEIVYRGSEIHDVTAMVIEEIEGPLDTPGSNQVSAKIKGASWNKQKSTGASTAKAVDPSKWHDAPPKNPAKAKSYDTVTVKP
jgi:hypothetical protein